MKISSSFFLLFLPFIVKAQLLVYTVAGNDTATMLNDGGPATAAGIAFTEGIWLDNNCNLYISDVGDNRIRKVSATTGIITTIAGTTHGYSGDGGPATDAQLDAPYGLYIDDMGSVYFADRSNYRIRRINAATGIITTFAGGGTSLGDGGPATNAQLTDPPNIYGDGAGNFYIGDKARIRKVDAAGIITTIAGTGTFGLSGDGGPATDAQLYYASGMLFDVAGDLIFADRGNSRIRKINAATGIITTIAGSTIGGSTSGFSGDGGPATDAQFAGPISFVIDNLGNIIIGDNGNNFIRKVDAVTGIITSFAGVGLSVAGTDTNDAPATVADIHPEFMYLDLHGNIYYSNYGGGEVRKIINYTPGLAASGSRCGPAISAVQQVLENNNIDLYPNPATDELHIKTAQGAYTSFTIINSIGQTMQQQYMLQAEMNVPIAALPPGMYYIKFNGSSGSEVQRFVKLP